MHFEWDICKDRTNRAKHGVGFNTAERVFDDPLALIDVSEARSVGTRWASLTPECFL